MSDVLDASALVALARDEPAAPDVEALLRQRQATITSINLGEAVDQLHRVAGVALDELRALFATLIGEALAVRDMDETLAWRAAELRGRHYRRRRAELSLADCTALAAAKPQRDRLATADRALAAAARAEGVEVVSLPASSGKRP